MYECLFQQARQYGSQTMGNTVAIQAQMGSPSFSTGSAIRKDKAGAKTGRTPPLPSEAQDVLIHAYVNNNKHMDDLVQDHP